MKLFAKQALASVVGTKQSGLGFGCMGITAYYGMLGSAARAND